LNSGRRKKQSYTSWSGTTFTIPSTDYSGDPATAPKDVMISYIDVLADDISEGYTAIYSSDRTLWVRVRDGGATPIKTFESSATFTPGGSITAIRTSDA